MLECWDAGMLGCWNAGMKDRDEGGDLKPEGRGLWEGKRERLCGDAGMLAPVKSAALAFDFLRGGNAGLIIRLDGELADMMV